MKIFKIDIFIFLWNIIKFIINSFKNSTLLQLGYLTDVITKQNDAILAPRVY